jgi:hypothetical protein
LTKLIVSTPSFIDADPINPASDARLFPAATGSAGASTDTASARAPWWTWYRSNTWYVGVTISFSPSVRIIAWSTFATCATLHIASLSAWRLKVSRVTAATSASRSVFCCHRKAGFRPGVGKCHVPHSSITSPTRRRGSNSSISARCCSINSSTSVAL